MKGMHDTNRRNKTTEGAIYNTYRNKEEGRLVDPEEMRRTKCVKTNEIILDMVQPMMMMIACVKTLHVHGTLRME